MKFVGGKEPVTIENESFYDYSYSDHFYAGPSFAFHLSVGAIAWRHWTADLGVWYLGTTRLEGYEDFEIRTEAKPNTTVNGSMAITLGEITPLLATLRVGYKF